MATATAARAPSADARLRAELAQAARRIRWADGLAGGLAVAVVALGYAAAVIALDKYLVLPRPARLAGLAAFLAAAGGVGYAAVYRRLRRRVNPRYAARQVEQTLADGKNAVINWVDLQDETLADAVRASLSRRAAEGVAAADVRKVSDSRAVLVLGVAAGLLVAALAGLFLAFKPAPFVSLVKRAFNPLTDTPIATRTVVTLDAPAGGDATVYAGDSLAVRVTVGGSVPAADGPDRVRLLVWYAAGGEPDEVALTPTAGREFAADLPPSVVQNGFGYKVTAGDGTTPDYRVTVVTRPVMTTFDAKYDYPAYTRLAPVADTNPHLGGPRGTVVTLTATANRPVRDGSLKLSYQLAPVPGVPVRGTPEALAFTVPLTESGTYRVTFATAAGEPGDPTASFPVAVTADAGPVVTIASPPETADATLPPDGVLAVDGLATDDYGVTGVVLRMKVVVSKTALMPVAYRGGQSLARPADGSFPARVEVKLSQGLAELKRAGGTPYTPAEGEVIEYWLEAADNCTVPAANVGESKHQTVTVGPKTAAADQPKPDPAARKKAEEQFQQQQDRQFQQEDRAPKPPRDNQPRPEARPKDGQPKAERPEGDNAGQDQPPMGQGQQADPKAGDNPPQTDPNAPPAGGGNPQPGAAKPGQPQSGQPQPGGSNPDATKPPEPGQAGEPGTASGPPQTGSAGTPPATPGGRPPAAKPPAVPPPSPEDQATLDEADRLQRERDAAAKPPADGDRNPGQPQPGPRNSGQPKAGQSPTGGQSAADGGKPGGTPGTDTKPASDPGATGQPAPAGGDPKAGSASAGKPDAKAVEQAARDLNSTDPDKKAAAEKTLDAAVGKANRKAAQKKAEQLKADLQSGDKAKREAAERELRDLAEQAQKAADAGKPGGDPNPTTEPAAGRPGDTTKPGDGKPAGTEKPEAKSGDGGKPDDGKPAGDKPGPTPDAGRPGDAGKPDGRPEPGQGRPDPDAKPGSGAKPGDDKPAGSKPDAGQSGGPEKPDAKPGESGNPGAAAKPGSADHPDAKPGDGKPAGGKPDAGRPGGPGQPDARPADGKPTTTAKPGDGVKPPAGQPGGGSDPAAGDPKPGSGAGGKADPKAVEKAVRDLQSGDEKTRQAARDTLDKASGRPAREAAERAAADARKAAAGGGPDANGDAEKTTADAVEAAQKAADDRAAGRPAAGPKPGPQAVADAVKDLRSDDAAKRQAARDTLDAAAGKPARVAAEAKAAKAQADAKSGDPGKQAQAENDLAAAVQDAQRAAANKSAAPPRQPTAADVAKARQTLEDLASPDAAKRRAAEQATDQAVGQAAREQLQRDVTDLKTGTPDQKQAAADRLQKQADRAARQAARSDRTGGVGGAPDNPGGPPLDGDPRNRLKAGDLQLKTFEQAKKDAAFLKRAGYTADQFDQFLASYRAALDRQKAAVEAAEAAPGKAPAGPPAIKIGEGSNGQKLATRPDGTSAADAGAGAGTAPPGFADAQKRFAEEAAKLKRRPR